MRISDSATIFQCHIPWPQVFKLLFEWYLPTLRESVPEGSFMLPTTDTCLTSGLTEAVQRILPALEQFLQFEDHDLAARDYPLWQDSLDEPLPQHGAGAGGVFQISG
jgi:hypothetical protein